MHTHHHGETHHRNHLQTAVFITLGFALVEAVAGWWSGSLALLGDAGHMVSDAAALALAALAAWIAQKPPSDRHSFGFGRIEVVAAIINSFAMIAIVIGIAGAAFERLAEPTEIKGVAVIIVAIIGLLFNCYVIFLLHGDSSLNTRAAVLHVSADLLGSVAALISGLVVTYTGWTRIDPLLSLLICALILYSAYRLVKESLFVIMEAVPDRIDLPEVGRAMAEVDGVKSVHDLHIWTLSSGRISLSAHVVVDELARWPKILSKLQGALRERFEIDHVTIQPEYQQEILHRMDG